MIRKCCKSSSLSCLAENTLGFNDRLDITLYECKNKKYERKRNLHRRITRWCHCPYYLQGTTHYGALSSLDALLSFLGEFELDIEDLETSWKKINRQIQELIEKNPEFQDVIDKLRKAKIKGSWASVKESVKKDEKVINLKDFLEPR